MARAQCLIRTIVQQRVCTSDVSEGRNSLRAVPVPTDLHTPRSWDHADKLSVPADVGLGGETAPETWADVARRRRLEVI